MIAPKQSGIGGIAQHVGGLIKYLKAKSHSVDVISKDNAPIIPIKGLQNPSFVFTALLRTWFMRKKYDIVHVHHIASALAMRSAKGKKILSIHGNWLDQIGMLHGKTLTSVSKRFEIRALRWADVITVVSQEMVDHYAKMGYNAVFVPNAVDVSGLSGETDRRYPKQVVSVGRLSVEKGTDVLVRIGEGLPADTHLLILGDGPDKQMIEDLDKRCKNVHYLGYQDKDKTIELIRGSDVLVQPALGEGVSSSVLEAMLCGTAVVTSDTVGSSEWMVSGVDSILVKQTDHESFIRQIDVVFNDKELQESLKSNALVTARKYNWESVGGKYQKIYESLLDK